MRMRLLFNATNLRSAGGVILLEQLLSGFLDYQGDSETLNTVQAMQLLLYHNPELSQRIEAWVHALPLEAQARIERVPLREPDGLRRFYWEQITLPGLIRQRQVDVLFSFGNTGPLFPGCRQILYLQQSIPFSSYRPQRHPLKWLRFQWLYGFLINLAQLGSQRIVVPTRWLVEPMRRATFYAKPTQAYQVTLPGIPPWPAMPKGSALSIAEQALLEKISTWRAAGEKILLYPCYLAPYKNIPALLEALPLVSKQNLPFKLILTFNAESPEYFPCKTEVLAAVAQCPPDQVILAGALSRLAMAAIYAVTDILVFPSLVETLGLPLLEAMAQGIPIVALDGTNNSGTSTLAAFAQEICQDAALYAPPHHPEALGAQIQRLLQDPELAHHVGKQGLHRATCFNWGQHVQQILEAI
jgi:glycosyltransferase involved in cell wall biosynthesis